MTDRVTLRPYRPDDYDVVRRWIDDPVISGGFPTAAPLHDDEEGELGDLVMHAMTREDWEE